MSNRDSRRRAELLPSLTPQYYALTPNGYITKTNHYTDTRHAHLLGEEYTIRRRGKLQMVRAPTKFKELHIHHEQQRSNLLHQECDPSDNLTNGNTLRIDERWPNHRKTGYIRVLFTNANGLSSRHNNIELEYFLQQCVGVQADIIGTVEVNQPLSTPSVRHDIRTCIKYFDRHAKIQCGHIRGRTTHRGFQMGGQLMIAQGGIAHVIKDSGHDDGGRWTWMSLGEIQLHVVIAYRVQPGTTGHNTIRAQEFCHLLKQKHPHAKNPRKAFDVDFKAFIKSIRQRGHPVFTLLDANSGHDEDDVKNLMEETGLENVLLAHHPTTVPLRTYNRGKKALDLGLACPVALKIIQAFGILEFYRICLSDHRSMYADLNEKMLMVPVQDQSKSILHAPSLLKPSTVKKFLARYKELLDTAGLVDKVKKIEERLPGASPGERAILIQRLNKYDQVWVQLVKAATKQTRCAVHGVKPWSPTLAKDGSIARYWNTRVRLFHTSGILDSIHIAIPRGYQPELVTTEHQLLQARDSATIKWHETKGNADDLRTQHLEDRIDAYAMKHDIKRESAVRQILHCEENKKLHSRQRQIMSSDDGNQLRSLLIPKPSSVDPSAHMEITDTPQILDVLLRRNQRKLGAAHNGYFNRGPLYEKVGEYADTQTADEILDGTFDVSQIDQWHDYEFKDELKAFITHLKRPTSDNGKVPDMQWTYGAQEFRDTFSKKSEFTACGPSGITMPYYKIFCEDDELASFHSAFIRLPFKFGFSLRRWQQSIQFMLLKTTVPNWEKLRIIQLLEGDFNGGLRYLFASKLMHHADVHNTSSEYTYGGRYGKSCHDALLRVQFFYEFHRTMRYPAIGSDIDATACYDRQLRTTISLCTRHAGVPKEAAVCQVQTLEKMQHKVKTIMGTSDATIRHTKETPMYGSGQGSGAGGTNWHCHNEVIFKAYAQFHPPTKMTGPDAGKTVDQAGVSFVDDNTLLHSFHPTTPTQEMLNKSQAAIGTWQAMMTASGGSLALPKCHNLLLSYKFNTFRYSKKSKYMGLPEIKKLKEIQGQCMVKEPDSTAFTTIRVIEPSKGKRLLGVRLAADGNCNDEFDFRLTQSRKMAGLLDNSAATPQDARMIYQFRYCPAVMYCTPITLFSKQQCDTIQRPFINVLLPKLRLNRHTKRAIIWGPRRYGGLQLKDMYTEQLARSIDKMIAHIRSGSAVGTTMQITIDAYQALIGASKAFFELDPSLYPHRPDAKTSKLTFLWESLFAISATLKIADQWLPTLRFANDIALMDAIIQTQQQVAGSSVFIPDQRIIFANACRLWLRVTTLSDIVDITNNKIAQWAMNGEKQNEIDGNFPYQPKPPPEAWKEWRMALRQCFLGKSQTHENEYVLLHPLSPALNPHSPFSWTPKLHLRGAPLKLIFSALPHRWQQLLAPTQWPCDDGDSLAASLRESEKVNGYLDGSVADGSGAHAYTIRPRCNNPNKAIVGTAMSPGDPETISSLRPEHYGGLCIAMWLWILEQRFGPIPSGTFVCHVDNDTVVKRINKGKPSTATTSHSLVTDYDLWIETIAVLENVQCKHHFKHVKGHQDDFIVKEGKQGPLNQHAFWNVQMDKIAAATRQTNNRPPVTPFFESSKIALMINGSAVTAKVSRAIRNALVADPLEQYICEREAWSKPTFDLVDWKAMDRAMTSLNFQKRVNASKYMFDWQNTGEQKQRFERSAARSAGREMTQVDLCPLKCGCQETAQHFLKCSVLHTAKITDQCFTSLHRWFARYRTHPMIQRLIMLAITAWIDDTELQGNIEVPADLQEWGIREAMAEQERLGWGNFMKGRITNKFGIIQMKAYQLDDKIETIPDHYSATWWTAGLIKEILYLSLNMWQQRNRFLHETETMSQELRDREEALDEVADWYDKKHMFPSTDQVHFHRSFTERCSDTTKQVRLWLQKIADLYEYNKQRTLQGFFMVP